MNMAITLHQDLLEQAFHLAKKERKRPSQASLRRSISASYYALFHYLIHEATRRICRAQDHSLLRYHLARTFQHSNMKNVAQQFSRNLTPESLRDVFESNTLNRNLVFVASSFVELQDARIEADYNLNTTFSRQKAIDLAVMSKQSFASWKQIRNTIQADTFLIGLHNQRNIQR